MAVQRLWRKVALALGGLLVLEGGARIAAPDLNGQALGDYLHNGGGTWLLTLYDRLGGGGLSRGGVLALGIMPYLSARIMVRLARVVSPAMEEMSGTSEGQRRLTRWTRVLTVGLAVVQSYGFARFVEGIPGAVTHPGMGFITQTMLVLTTGSIVAMALSERITRPDDEELRDPPAADPLLGSGQNEPIDVHVPTGDTVRTR
jgi:preprotein translocase subunit SecY